MSDFPSTLGELEWADEAVPRRVARREAARAASIGGGSSATGGPASPPHSVSGAASSPPPPSRQGRRRRADYGGGDDDGTKHGDRSSDRTLATVLSSATTASSSASSRSIEDGFTSRRDLYREAALRSTGRAASMQHGTVVTNGGGNGGGGSASSLHLSQSSATSLPRGERRGGDRSNRSMGGTGGARPNASGSNRSVGGSRTQRRRPPPAKRSGSVVINRQRRRLSVGRTPSEQSILGMGGGSGDASSSIAGGDEIIEIEYMDEVRFEEMVTGKPRQERDDEEETDREISPGESSTSGSGSSSDDAKNGGSNSSGNDLGRTEETRGESLDGFNSSRERLEGSSSSRRGFLSSADKGLDGSTRSHDELCGGSDHDDADEESSFGDFSVKLRKAQGRVCPQCGYLDCSECCRGCCDQSRRCSEAASASCSDPSDRRLYAFVLVVTALIVALPAIVRAAIGGGGSSGAAVPPSMPAGAATDYRPLLLPAYFEDNLSDREDYRKSVLAFGTPGKGREGEDDEPEAAPGTLGSFKSGNGAAAEGSDAVTAPAAAHAHPRELPIFWSVPLSAPSFVQDALGRCHGLVLASDIGGEVGHAEEAKLQVVEVDGAHFVDVDLTDPGGVARAARLDLAGSGTADVALTPLLHATAKEVLSPASPGRLMALFRHPVRRVEAEYNLLRHLLELQAAEDGEEGEDGSETDSADLRVPEEIANLTLEEYAQSDYAAADNEITRRLVLGDDTSSDRNRELTEIELILAKEILRRKATVGLHDDLPGAADAFASAVGAAAAADGNIYLIKNDAETKRCVRDLADEHVAGEREQAGQQAPLEERSDAWNSIAERNKFDVALYEYAAELYRYREGGSDSRRR